MSTYGRLRWHLPFVLIENPRGLDLEGLMTKIFEKSPELERRNREEGNMNERDNIIYFLAEVMSFKRTAEYKSPWAGITPVNKSFLIGEKDKELGMESVYSYLDWKFEKGKFFFLGDKEFYDGGKPDILKWGKTSIK